MAKSIRFDLDNGDLSKGFYLRVKLYGENNKVLKEYRGCNLEPNSKIEELCSQWRSNHRDTNTRTLNEIVKNTAELPRFYGVSNLEAKYRGKGGESGANTGTEIKKIIDDFESEINRWLATKELSEIIKELETKIHKDEEVRCIVVTDDNNVKSIPWHLWKLFEQFTQAEIAFSTPELEQEDVSNSDKDELCILAVLGNDEGINLEKDREFLNALPFAKTEFLQKPSRIELEAKLEQEAIDILFFAGHSKTEAKRGIIHLNDTETLEIEALDKVLRIAIANGLQLAIFNSCDGLGIADKLAQLQIPQVIVMRELVPNLIAQEFLKRFLYYLSQGFSFYWSFRTSRNELQVYKEKFPFASWLPTLFQHPFQSPLSWKSVGLDSIRKKKPLNSPLEYLTLDEYEKYLDLYSPAFKIAKTAENVEEIIEYYRQIQDQRDNAALTFDKHIANTTKNFLLYKKLYGGEDISLVDGLIINNTLTIADYLKLIEICQEDAKLENLLALIIQALGRIKNKYIRDSITYNTRLINELCKLIKSESSQLLIWSAAATLDLLNIKKTEKRPNVPEELKSRQKKIIEKQIKRFASINSFNKKEYQKFVDFWLYGARYELRSRTSSLKFHDTFTLWQNNYNNNVNYDIFDVCWKINQELGMRGILEETILFKRAAVSTSNALVDKNEIFQGIALELATTPIDWIKYPYKQSVSINYCIQCLVSDNQVARRKAMDFFKNKDIFAIDFLQLKTLVNNFGNFLFYEKGKVITVENEYQELLIVTTDLEYNCDNIITDYIKKRSIFSKLNFENVRNLLDRIHKFDDIYKIEDNPLISHVSAQRKICDLKNKPIRIHKRILTIDEFKSLTIILNNLENIKIIERNFCIANLIEKAFKSPSDLEEYAHRLAEIEFLRDFFSDKYYINIKSLLNNQYQSLRDNQSFAKEFKKCWKHNFDVDFLRIKRKLKEYFFLKPQYDFNYYIAIYKLYNLFYMYEFIYIFFTLHPSLYNSIKTNSYFINWKKSLVEAIKLHVYNLSNISLEYEQTISNFSSLINEINLLIEQEIVSSKNKYIEKKNQINNKPQKSENSKAIPKKARHIGNAYYLDINFTEHRSFFDNKLGLPKKQMEQIKQDIIVYSTQLSLIDKGAKEILEFDKAIKCKNYSAYIDNLTRLVNRQEKFNKYQKYILSRNGSLYWDEEDDFIENNEEASFKNDVDWSKAKKYLIPSFCVTALTTLFFSFIGHLCIALFQLIVGTIGISKYWLFLLIFLLSCISLNIKSESMKQYKFIDTFFDGIVVSCIIIFFCFYAVGLVKLKLLYQLAIFSLTIGNIFLVFLSAISILLVILITGTFYYLCLYSFLQDSSK